LAGSVSYRKKPIWRSYIRSRGSKTNVTLPHVIERPTHAEQYIPHPINSSSLYLLYLMYVMFRAVGYYVAASSLYLICFLSFSVCRSNHLHACTVCATVYLSAFLHSCLVYLTACFLSVFNPVFLSFSSHLHAWMDVCLHVNISFVHILYLVKYGRVKRGAG